MFDNKQYQKDWYLKNKEKHKKNASIRKKQTVEDNKIKLVQYLKNHPCVDCGESNILVLEFDHECDKLYPVTKLLGLGYNWNKILAEIEKCKVRCANCHSIKTYTRANSYRLQFI